MAEETPDYRKIIEDVLEEANRTGRVRGFKLSTKLRGLLELALKSGDKDQLKTLAERYLPDELPLDDGIPFGGPAEGAPPEEPKPSDPSDTPETLRKLAERGVRPVPGKVKTRPIRDVPPTPPKGRAPAPKSEAPKSEAPTEAPKGAPTAPPRVKTTPIRELPKREGGVSPSDLRPPPEETPAPKPAAPAPAPAKPSRRESATFKRRMERLRSAASSKANRRVGGIALAALSGFGLAKLLKGTPADVSSLREQEEVSRQRSASAKIAQLLEQARMERTLAQNQARLAQANPTLYTSVMAGRKVPTGAVVLGGRPRTDLMRELAASMDSGAFQKRDPLSDLMG